MERLTGASSPGDASALRATDAPLRILVVDDDAVDRMAVRRALARSGLASAVVTEASDAGEVLARLDAGIDCVLLDYELAGHTGLDVLRRMSADGHAVPVVMLTGQKNPETAAALIKAGAADFVTKENLTPGRIEQTIRSAIRMACVERELEESRERLAATLRSVGDAVITLDAEGRVAYLNPAAEELTGRSAAEALRQRLDALVPVEPTADDESPGRTLEAIVRQVVTGRVAARRTDLALRTGEGGERVVDVTVTPMRGRSGAPSGAVVALRDITARKRAEAALAATNEELQAQAEELEQQFEESQAMAEELEQANDQLLALNLEASRNEARYRALVEASAHLVWRTDASGHVDDMPGWRAVTGQSRDEVRGVGWLDALHPDDRERAAQVWWAAFERKALYQNEYRMRRADGSYRWHRARGVPVMDDDGTIREWVGTLEDIDDERRAEEARREEADLVETLHRISGVLTSELDVERLVTTVTDAATALTGAQFGAFFYNVIDAHGEKLTLYSLSGAPREAFRDFGHPRPTPVFAPTFHGTEPVVRSDDITKDPRYGQLPPHHGMPPGHLPVRSYLAAPVISRQGEVLGGLFFGHSEPGVFTERSERLVRGIASSASVAMDNARLYDAERRARAEAEVANRTKAEFLANMSHELRTPLNAIGGYADLVLAGIRGPVSEAQRTDLERIKRSQRHLLGLINDILNFAKLEAGSVRFEMTDVPVDAALAELEPLIAPQLTQKSLRFTLHHCDRPVTAHVDPERLQQILLNLLSNAVKFTPAGGEISLRCEGGPDMVHIHVADTGIGIPADRREHIFEPFVQLERGQSAHNAGTGLGLSISRDLARAMGGELTVESEVDVGSTFTLHLPRRTPAR